ncbi:MAG: LuxR family transcriptional regulator [Candidatus Eremiobacteraeota bacterium]|nr:LuxR family transcriptional regulator [Candidatus Eremiobacteraeota bacterium]
MAQAKKDRVPAAIRVVGQSGIGKSALLLHAAQAAHTAGWLSAAARCHEIQAKLAMSGAQRLAFSIMESLGSEQDRYAAESLGAALRGVSGNFEEAFLRLVDGVSLDFPLLLTIDDAQWLDRESRNLIEQTLRSFSSRPIVLLVAERPQSTNEPDAWLGFALTLRIERLPEAAAADVVRTYYPGATAEVTAAIVSQSVGHPIGLVMLAQAARDNSVAAASELTTSVRIVIARQLDAMTPSLREFLQICALMAEPISYRVLTKLWLDESALLSYIEHASGRYLLQEGEALRFAHAAIVESIRETMPIEIPYRRRILRALLSIEQPSLSESEAIVEQAAACSDVEVEYEHLLKLADEATQQQAFLTASDAYERALMLRSPAPSELVAFYRKYALALDNQSRFVESASLLRRALRDAAVLQVPDSVGILGSLLVASVASTEGVQASQEAYEHYLAQATQETDRVLLHSIGSFSYVCRCDEVRFSNLKTQVFDHVPVNAVAGARLLGCEALLHSRQGRYADALRSLERAAMLATTVPVAQRMTTEYARGFVEFFQFGTNVASSEIRGTDPLDPIRAMNLVAVGDWDDARSFISAATISGRQTISGLQLLALEAAMAVLTKSAPRSTPEFQNEIRLFDGGSVKDTAVPLGGWWAALLAVEDKGEAAKLLQRVEHIVKGPISPFALFMPVSLVIAAHRLGDRRKLDALTEMRDVWCDRNPWNLAHRDLAIGLARTLVGHPKGADELDKAAGSFDRLGAPFFAAYARGSSSRRAVGAMEFLASLGVVELPEAQPALTKRAGAASGPAARPTARERQVAGLVAAGHTNREIAEQLVLSERTVEAHMSNLFNKIGVSSRTQLAAWYFAS